MRTYLFGAACLCLVAGAHAADYNNWPTRYTTEGGTEWKVTGNYQYDFTHSRHTDLIDDAHTHRRKELGATVRRNGEWDAMVYFDFQSKRWLDVYARIDSAWLFGEDYGKFRIGHTKIPVGLESNTGSRAHSFIELSLPVLAHQQSRRTGVDWSLERPAYLIQAGYYPWQDFQGDNDGTTTAARFVWTPRKAAGDVLHLGASGAIEHPHGTTDGRDVYKAPSARWQARPEHGLTDVRLVDSGALSQVRSIQRSGVEGLRIKGPWSVQGEYMRSHISRRNGLPNYTIDGYYAFASYVLTGESRGYTAGNMANLKPRSTWGAVELLARYSALDLDDRSIRGGRQHNVTLGANWYLTQYFKFEGNYLWARASRQGVQQSPDIVELRAQVAF